MGTVFLTENSRKCYKIVRLSALCVLYGPREVLLCLLNQQMLCSGTWEVLTEAMITQYLLLPKVTWGKVASTFMLQCRIS